MGVPLWLVCQSTTSGCKGGFLLREHRARPQEGIQRSLSINMLEVGGDGERHRVPSTRAVTPVSRARQQGCPTARLKCSCAATQAALVPTDVCLPKETDTISQPYNNSLQQKKILAEIRNIPKFQHSASEDNLYLDFILLGGGEVL